MADDAFSPALFRGPAYALVIGISTYKYGQDPDDGKSLGHKHFRNLKVAAKDAEDFANFLRSHGFIPNNVTLLPDDQATARDIKIAFRRLSESCNDPDAKDPLVIVYFSGHGMAEDENRHYLVPWEGERDEPAATAVSNEDFNGLLDGLNTKRLVVFLDACHSGGMVGAERKRAKDGALPEYDSRGLGGGGGRIVIASCKRGQQSYESGKNGIFTGKLLGLLSGESPYFKDKEEIELLDLYGQLRKEVDRAAQQEHKQKQEPQINEVKESTGIVLAINERAIKKRREEEQRANEQKIEEDRQAFENMQKFLDSINDQLRRMSNPALMTGSIASILRIYTHEDYDDRKRTFDKHVQFFTVFEEHLGLWHPGDDVDVCCQLLISEYAEATRARRASPRADTQAPPKPTDKESSGPVDRMEHAPRNTVVGPQDPNTLVTPSATSVQQSSNRMLSEADLRLQFRGETRTVHNVQPSGEVYPDVQPARGETQSGPTERTGVFISYSHKDRKWLTELQTMLKPLMRTNNIDLWDDTKIDPGAIWKEEIQKALASSKVAVLLVSANFLASDFIAKSELPPLLEAAKEKGVVVFWIYVSSCMYETTEIAKYQAAHDIARPLDRLSKPNRQVVLSEVCARIKTLIK